jgi:hypothetical protein
MLGYKVKGWIIYYTNINFIANYTSIPIHECSWYISLKQAEMNVLYF